MEEQELSEMVRHLIRAGYEVLKQRAQFEDVTDRFVVELYFHVRRILKQADIESIENLQNQCTTQSPLVDILAFCFYSLTIMHLEAKNSISPDIIQRFRDVILNRLQQYTV